MSRKPASETAVKSGQHTQPRANAFLCVLYPDNPDHCQMMHYLDAMKCIFEWVRILHDKDLKDPLQSVVVDGKPATNEDIYKKAHYHYLLWYKESKTLSAELKFWKPFGVEYMEICNNIRSSLLYFCHQSPAAVKAGKHIYGVECLEGSAKLISRIGLNSNLVQLSEALKLLRDHDGNVADLVLDLANNNPVYGENVLSTIQSYQGLFVCSARQEFLTAGRRNES